MIRPGTRARVTVPATSANLGPGFDALGLALGVRDEYEVLVTRDSAVTVAASGESATDMPTGPDHLVARSLLAALERFGAGPVGFALTCRNRVPQGRGMGSSAAAIVGGVALGALLARGEVADLARNDPEPQSGSGSTAEVVALATEIEGHPDNVAAAAMGGLTVSWVSDDGRGRATALPVLPGITPVLFIPEATSPTSQARAALPDVVPHADAAFNVGRSALLVAALTQDSDLLLPATEDRLHQRQRRTTYANSLDVVAALREVGWPAAVSGAGPTVVVLTRSPQAAAEVGRLTFEGFTAQVSQVGTGAHATRIAETVS